MPVPIAFTRDIAGNLLPADDESKAAIMDLKPGKIYRADVVMARNYNRLKWWWKLCAIVEENSEHYASQKAVSDMLKLKCGHFETIVVPGKTQGEWVTQYVPGSIAFASMKEPDFKALCNKAVHVCASVLSVQSEQLHEALDQFFAPKSHKNTAQNLPT